MWRAAGGEATRIVSPVGNVTVLFGGDAVLSCVVDDLGYGEVSWVRGETVMTRNDKVLMDDARIQVSSDGRNWSLRIGRVSPEDVGCYACKVETRESVGCLVVQKSPDIVDDESSGDLTVNKGEDARLSCRARGNPPPKIQWRREDGRDILQIRPDDSRGRDYLISVALGIPYGNWTRCKFLRPRLFLLSHAW
ncbi:unnamed protein product [Darwinula stevensoni]|uniref:Ig-like domain-containing protein n=1 Tax=Darwinula stevensoni TaxID=69355 RepID=A0A7R9FTG9_9CRUS|nr:unnamed protein product [Darwinula stevensoni]CAG0906000.1 unnamed protein product [Darwinula stevensoni]